MKILFIAPLPPPIDGQSKASKVLFDALTSDSTTTVEVINYSKTNYQNGIKNGSVSIKRLTEIFIVLKKIFISNENDIIYLSLSESPAGNIKDLLIYLICFRNHSNMIVHMLGGAGMKKILEKGSLQSKINGFFIKRLGGVIVESKLNYDVFSKVISGEKIHIVPNFAEDFLFVSDKEIEKKFQNINPLKILYLSNLIPGKGYLELLEAFIELSDELKQKVKVVFVGGFESKENETEFLNKLQLYEQLSYYGTFVNGDEKRQLFCNSHIFCLPTYYPFEGQPISILEAYATGCFVMTTNHSGIPYMFTDNINGFEVQKQSSNSIRLAIERVFLHQDKLLPVAFLNRDIALEKYRTSIYQKSLIKIINDLNTN